MFWKLQVEFASVWKKNKIKQQDTLLLSKWAILNSLNEYRILLQDIYFATDHHYQIIISSYKWTNYLSEFEFIVLELLEKLELCKFLHDHQNILQNQGCSGLEKECCLVIGDK